MKNNQGGMTFIEVLIALVIIVTGILGAVAMQATAKKGSFDAMQRSLASSLAQDIIERMRNNDRDNLAAYAANSPYGSGKISSAPTCNKDTSCSAGQMVTNDLYGWEQALMGNNAKFEGAGIGLVNAVGFITHAANAVTVVITWDGRESLVDGSTESCGGTGTKRRQVQIEAFLY